MLKLLSALIALGRVVPFLSKLLNELERVKLAKTHDRIDQAVADAQKRAIIADPNGNVRMPAQDGERGQVPPAPRV